MAGLAAARVLRASGRETVVVDKGRGVGGRMASRRIANAVFDHGAQFFTARDPGFHRSVESWLGAGAAREWCRGFGGAQDGHPRWRGTPSMTAVPKALAEGLDVRTERRVLSIVRGRGEDTWLARFDDGEPIRARSIIMTPPVPQSLAILAAGETEVDPSLHSRLSAIEYERCLAVMAVLDGPSGIPEPGVVRDPGGPIAWIADNAVKGVSPVPAVTIHAHDAFSRESWGGDREAAGRELIRSARRWIGSNVTDFQVHGWRYSKPVGVFEERFCIAGDRPTLILAGDAFAGPRVEGAALSGRAAAEALIGQ
ncbi:MAG: NAD(P)-binding protein [Gemmatimonadetes bacterium]|nr:NAD(P)-binding protein [Gemmatimonadota bacterium]